MQQLAQHWRGPHSLAYLSTSLQCAASTLQLGMLLKVHTCSNKAAYHRPSAGSLRGGQAPPSAGTGRSLEALAGELAGRLEQAHTQILEEARAKELAAERAQQAERARAEAEDCRTAELRQQEARLQDRCVLLSNYNYELAGWPLILRARVH
jgi:hypothetical protein